jgi:MOSC domain-containing protein YiiM
MIWRVATAPRSISTGRRGGRMEEAYPGLLKALYPEWRGGVTCRVLSGGAIATGDPVVVTFSPPEVRRKLPG